MNKEDSQSQGHPSILGTRYHDWLAPFGETTMTIEALKYGISSLVFAATEAIIKVNLPLMA